MAAKNKKNENPSDLPSDIDLFLGDVKEEITENDVFVTDEVFFSDDSTESIFADNNLDNKIKSAPKKKRRIRVPVIETLVTVIIIFVGIILINLFRNYSQAPVIKVTQEQITKPTQPIAQPSKPSPQPRELPLPNIELSADDSFSLNVAENLYLNKQYENAYAAYYKLHETLPPSVRQRIMKDFLRLKMALCKKFDGQIESAANILRTILRSRSPVIRTLANYQLSIIEMQNKRYTEARTKAYQALALLDAVDFDKDWAQSLQRDCHFLAAESITRNVLSLTDSDKDLPEELWTYSTPEGDPFIGLSESAIRKFLNSGTDKLSKALLSPQIEKLTSQDDLQRWSATCHGAPIEEVLGRLASNTGMDIQWQFGPESMGIQKRMASLYMPAVTTQQFAKIASGSVGLLSVIDDNKIIIYNMETYTSLSEFASLNCAEAITLWEQFLLNFYTDKRVPNAHFALGMLFSQKSQVANAIAEYKLVANRFPQTILAPFALLHSSKLKTNLRDYLGAREDLKQLVEQYPDSEISGKACLYLADTSFKAKLYDEAERLYRKVYNLNFSTESHITSALGAGNCFFKTENFEEAKKWIVRYINESLSADMLTEELNNAYILLGKTNMRLGLSEQAIEAFEKALTGELPRDQYVQNITTLVNAYNEQNDYVSSLNLLENIKSWQFSQKESTELLILKSKTLRLMGLEEKAISVIGDRADYIPDPQLKAMLSCELIQCYIKQEKYEIAYDELTELLVYAKPGHLAQQAASQLADICMKLNKNAQAISICYKLLNTNPPEEIKNQALKIMADAYKRQKDYNKAALALLGQWK